MMKLRKALALLLTVVLLAMPIAYAEDAAIEPAAEVEEIATIEATEEPTPEPTEEPTPEPTEEPVSEPTEESISEPTGEPAAEESGAEEQPVSLPDAPKVIVENGWIYNGEDQTLVIPCAESDDAVTIRWEFHGNAGGFAVATAYLEESPEKRAELGIVADSFVKLATADYSDGWYRLSIAAILEDGTEITGEQIFRLDVRREEVAEPTEEPTAELTPEPTAVPVFDPEIVPTIEPMEEPLHDVAVSIEKIVGSDGRIALCAVVETQMQGEILYRWQALNSVAYTEMLLAGEIPDVESLWVDIANATEPSLNVKEACGEAYADYLYRCVVAIGDVRAISEAYQIEAEEKDSTPKTAEELARLLGVSVRYLADQFRIPLDTFVKLPEEEIGRLYEALASGTVSLASNTASYTINGVKLPFSLPTSDNVIDAKGEIDYYNYGTGCYAFVSYVYNKLFKKTFSHFDTFDYVTTHGTLIPLTANNLKTWVLKAGPGAVVRVQKYSKWSDSDANDNPGHSFVVISADNYGAWIYEATDSSVTARPGYVMHDNTIIYTTWGDLVGGLSNIYNGYQYLKYIKYPGTDHFTTSKPTSISVDQDTTYIHYSQKVTLTANVYPATATKGVVWSASPANIVEFSDTSSPSVVVHGINAGTATITCTSLADNSVKGTCEVTVRNAGALQITGVECPYYYNPDSGNWTLRYGTVSSSSPLTYVSYEVTNSSGKLVAYFEKNFSNGEKFFHLRNLGSTGIFVKTLSKGSYVWKVSFADSTGKGITTSYVFTVGDEYATTIGYSEGYQYGGTVYVQGITLNKKELTLKVGSSERLTPTASPQSASNINVKWTSSNTSVATVSANGVVTGVGTGTATITCAAVDGSDVKATCTVKVQNLAAPKLTSVTNTATGIKIAWDKVSGAARYRVYYRTGTSGSFAKLVNTSAGSYTWTGAKSGTTYNFTVRCLDSDGNVVSSYDTKGLTITYVAAPKLSSVTNAATGIKIAWGKVTGASRYRIYYRVGTTGAFTKLINTSAASYTWTGAKSGTKYNFTVRALNSSNEVISGYDSTGTTITYVAAPKISSVTNTATGVKIAWGKVTGASKYRVYYRVGTSGTFKKLVNTSAGSYTWTGAASGTKYNFTVRALNSSNEVISGYDSTGKTITYVAAPKLTSVSKVSTGIKVAWDKVAGAEKYRVYYREGASGSFKKLADTSAVSYTWTEAKSGTTYNFTVRCLNSAGTLVSGYDSTGKTIAYKK